MIATIQPGMDSVVCTGTEKSLEVTPRVNVEDSNSNFYTSGSVNMVNSAECAMVALE